MQSRFALSSASGFSNSKRVESRLEVQFRWHGSSRLTRRYCRKETCVAKKTCSISCGQEDYLAKF